MRTVFVANPKGGCGKTTIATNIAGHYARHGKRVLLSDMDRQQSSLRWLERRPPSLPRIHWWDGRGQKPFSYRFVPDWVVLDGPAGMRGERLKSAVRHVDHVLIPVMASVLDMEASEDFLRLLSELKRVRKERCRLALVGNRVNRRVLSARDLDAFFAQFDLPVLTLLRDTQNYVRAAADGMSLFDLPVYRARRDRGEWEPIFDWLEDHD